MGRVQEKLRSPWAIGLIILCAFAAGFGVSFVSRTPAPPAEGKISISDFRVELPEGETVVTITSRDADSEELGRLSIYRRGDKILGVPAQPRQDYWGYTHGTDDRSDQWGFRVVFVPAKQSVDE